MPLQYGPEREGRGEDAEEEVGGGEGDDERVARVRAQLGRGDDDGEDEEVEEAAGEHDGDVQDQQQVVDRGGDVQVPQQQPDLLQFIARMSLFLQGYPSVLRPMFCLSITEILLCLPDSAGVSGNLP